jgi:hypothetical protein
VPRAKRAGRRAARRRRGEPTESDRSENGVNMQYRGSCHCGKVKIQFQGTVDGAVSCNCSICSKRGSLLWFTARDTVEVTGEDELTTYTFNKHVIKHRFCKTCGVLTHGEGKDAQGNLGAAINIRCLDDFDFTKVPVHPYDGKSA